MGALLEFRPTTWASAHSDESVNSLHQLDLPGSPALVEPRLKRAIQTQGREPVLARRRMAGTPELKRSRRYAMLARLSYEDVSHVRLNVIRFGVVAKCGKTDRLMLFRIWPK